MEILEDYISISYLSHSELSGSLESRYLFSSHPTIIISKTHNHYTNIHPSTS